jgi:hypothetical protein
MLRSLKYTAIQITTAALLTAGATLAPFATTAIASPASYAAQNGDDGSFSSPGSVNHHPSINSGGN